MVDPKDIYSLGASVVVKANGFACGKGVDASAYSPSILKEE